MGTPSLLVALDYLEFVGDLCCLLRGLELIRRAALRVGRVSTRTLVAMSHRKLRVDTSACAAQA